jgi:hypothetical protein
MIPSQPLPRGEHQRAVAAAAAEQLVEVLRGLADVDQVDEEQLVALAACARLVLDETHRLFAAGARRRGAYWLYKIDDAVALRTRALRAGVSNVSLDALSRRLAAREGRAA